jgi:hypothetical protein
MPPIFTLFPKLTNGELTIKSAVFAIVRFDVTVNVSLNTAGSLNMLLLLNVVVPDVFNTYKFVIPVVVPFPDTDKLPPTILTLLFKVDVPFTVRP